jgi:hypothetical protein
VPCPERCQLVRVPVNATGGAVTTLSVTATAPGLSGKVGPDDLALAATGANLWIFDSASHRVLLSTDSGRTFRTFALAPGLTGCAYKASTTTIVWATCERGEYRSHDGGRTFTAVRDSTTATGWDPVNTTTIYAVTDPPGMGGGIVLRSIDQGRTFTNLGVTRRNAVCYPTFTTPSRGIALCEDIGGSPTTDGLIGTGDAGRTWATRLQP